MKKNPEQTIDPKNPWDGDVLGREETGIYLTNLLKSIDEPFVISINSTFGTGKTNFLNRWKHHIVEEKIADVVYFDAWETDYAIDPLAALICKIKKQLPPNIIKEFLQIVDQLTMYAFEHGAPYLVAAKTGFSPEITKSAISKVKSTTNKLKKSEREKNKYGQHYGQIIEHFENTTKTIVSFRNILQKAITKTKTKKLVILIDELDRCRPNYAIELLECIKHLFNVEGIIFVVAVDKRQLASAIKSIYGTDIDSNGYLRKFFNWQLNLPKPSKRDFTKHLIEQYDLSNNFGENHAKEKLIYTFTGIESFVDYFSSFSEILELTLRDQEQAFVNVDLILKSLKSNKIPFTAFLGLFVTLHNRLNEDEFERFCKNSLLEKDRELLFTNNGLLGGSISRTIISEIISKEVYDIVMEVLHLNETALLEKVKYFTNKGLNSRYIVEKNSYMDKAHFYDAIKIILKEEKCETLGLLLFNRIEKAASLTSE